MKAFGDVDRASPSHHLACILPLLARQGDFYFVNSTLDSQQWFLNLNASGEIPSACGIAPLGFILRIFLVGLARECGGS